MKRDINSIFTNIPAPLKKPLKMYSFGTAGYRSHASELAPVLCRASLIALIRSSTFCGKTIGVVITASHNHKDDNGIKIIDHNGEYIDKALEVYCDEIVNCEDKDLLKILNKIHRKMGNCRDLGQGANPVVAVGRDTRKSGEYFAREICNILQMCGCKVVDCGVATTPEMHFIVRRSNLRGEGVKKQDYVEHLIDNYRKLVKYTGNEYKVYVDTANGVGAHIIEELRKNLPEKPILIINRGVNNSEEGFEPDVEMLNDKCGADYVVSNKRTPENISVDKNEIMRCASFDGDADRLIYFSNVNGFKLIDGDRTAVIIGNFIKELCSEIKNVKIGVVLSHYSNSGAINFLKEDVKVVLASTGVKNFVKLSRGFDIGIFFEPNGHGSVTFSYNIIKILDEILKREDTQKQAYISANILKILSNLFDPCVGDAIANFLVIEAISSETFDEEYSLYSEMPTRMLSVRIRDKNQIILENETDIKEPKELRENIKLLSKKYKGRCFVRPSGTEDIVRVFAESENREECDILCLNAAQAVYDLCEGIGYHPEIKY